MGRRIADVVGEVTNDFERFFRLPDLKQLADEILVVLQSLQQAGELRARVVELLGRAFGLRLELAPLVN